MLQGSGSLSKSIHAKRTKFYELSTLEWRPADVRGTSMDEARIMNGENGVYSGYYRMREGTEIRSHVHLAWVQVVVVMGRIEVSNADGISVVEAGNCYVVPAGNRHIERALADSIVLVTGPEQ